MFVRLALESDMEAVVEMARLNVSETKTDELTDFSADQVRATFRAYLETALTTFFVVDDKRRVVAFLQAGIHDYDYRDGFYTTQRVMFVLPEKRGTRAAVLLVKELIRWSAMLGAFEIVGGNDNSFKSDRTAGFLEHFGFGKVGYAMAKRLGDPTDGR